MVGKRSGSSKWLERKPHFFKVLLGDFAQRLKIPPNFSKHVLVEASNRATLQGPSGHIWHAELSKTMKGMFLATGWPEFVKDHSLKEHEFLVFRYDGNLHFTVLMFDITACEREDVFTVSPHRETMYSEGRNEQGRLPNLCLDFSSPVKNEASEGEVTELLINQDPSPNQLQLHCSSAIQGYPPSRNSSGKVEIKAEEELPICMIGSSNKVDRRLKGYMSRRRPVTAEERAKAREAAYLFTSRRPYVIMYMSERSAYRTYMLRLPRRFSRAHLPRKKTNVVLRDPTGKAWVVVYIPSSRDRLSGGWSAFARGNCLEEGDYCAFELVGPVEFHIHIFRVVEETVPVVRISARR